MEGVVRAEEGAEFDACFFCLGWEVSEMVGDWGSWEVVIAYLLPAIWCKLHSVIWHGLVDVSILLLGQLSALIKTQSRHTIAF